MISQKSKAIIACMAIVTNADQANAQDAETSQTKMQPLPGSDKPSCQLHVWPSQGLKYNRHHTQDAVFFDVGALSSTPRRRIEGDNAKVRGRPIDETAPLNTAHQVVELKKHQIADVMGLAGYTIRLHTKPLPRAALRKVKTRFVRGASDCYAELILSDVIYSRESGRGQNLKVFYHFRDFPLGSDKPSRKLGTWAQTKLEFDREKVEEGKIEATTQQLISDLEVAFEQNLTRFAGFLQQEEKP